MKILLVNPPNCGRSIPEEQYGIDSLKQIMRAEPLSLEALAGNLDEHEVRIVDLKAQPDTFGEALAGFAPDIVGITGVTCEANTMLKLASEVKRESEATVVVGGVHASNDPSFFNSADIDFIVAGLGKKSFRVLAETLRSGKGADEIPGVTRTNPGGCISLARRKCSGEDLVDDKPPRYDLVNMYREHYFLESLNLQFGLVSVAFGCPYRCSFCSIHHITGGTYLTHSTAAVLRDIRIFADLPAVIRLVDANTFGDAGHARGLAGEIIKAGIKKQFVADVRSDTVVRHPDLFREWKEAGLRSVIIGFEEVDDTRLSEINKVNTVAVNTEAIEILHDIGITIIGDFIVSPDYDDRQFQSLRDYLSEHPVDLPMLSILTPLPGTPLYESMKERITIHDLDFYTLTNAVVPTNIPEKAFYENYADLMRSSHAGAKL